MPYLPLERKKSLGLESISRSPGDLTYIIYREALGLLGPAARFEDYAKVLGAIEAAKLELYRQQVAHYEDVAIARNGGVK